jgi:outer membrane lipoprotein-sorting protein
MKRTAILILAALLTLASFTSFAASSESQAAMAQKILQDIQKKMAPVHSVYLEFTQERVLKLFSKPIVSQGVMLLERPDKIRWETTEPYQTILLGDGSSVAQFERDDGKWQKLKLGFPQMLQHVMEQMSAMNQGNMSAMTDGYDISVSTNNGTVLTLVPKDENVRQVMSSLEIHLAPDLTATREVVMNEPDGDLTRISFHDEKHDVKFPDGTFDQNHPLPIATVKAAVNHAP